MAPAFGAGDPEALSRVKPQNWLDWVAQQSVFESMTAIATAEVTLLPRGGGPEDLSALRTTASFFDVFRIRPALGRAYAVEEEEDGRHRVAILSHALWQRRFNADPTIVGQSISLDDGAYEVIGVMAPQVTYPVGTSRPTDVWMPYVVPLTERTRGSGVAIYLQVVARLKAGATLEQAQAQMTQVAAAIEQANPEWNRGSLVGVRPLGDHLVGASTRSWMLMLLAAVAIVLLIACTNVANLLLARATTREREVAVRAALGAGRWRLVRQFLVESLVLAVAGAALGVLLAWWAVAILRNAMPEEVPRAAMIAINWRVLLPRRPPRSRPAVCSASCRLCTRPRPNLTGGLNQGTRSGGASRGRQRLRRALLVAEVGLAVVLVVGSTLFTISFMRVMHIDPGLEPAVLADDAVVQRNLPGQRPTNLSDSARRVRRPASADTGRRQRRSSWSGIPLRGQHARQRLRLHRFVRTTESRQHQDRDAGLPQDVGHPSRERPVVCRLRRRERREVAIINAAAARQFFGTVDPIGRMAVVARGGSNDRGDHRRHATVELEIEPLPEAYLPLAQGPLSSGFVVVRTQGDPYRVLPAARAALSTVLPTVPLRQVASMDEMIDRQTARRRITMLMLGLFGVLGLAIAVVGRLWRDGVCRVAAHPRDWRPHGARRDSSERHDHGRQPGGMAATAGVVIGTAAAWCLTSTVQSFLFELTPTIRPACRRRCGVAAGRLRRERLPARRAASVDPTVAFRSEWEFEGSRSSKSSKSSKSSRGWARGALSLEPLSLAAE